MHTNIPLCYYSLGVVTAYMPQSILREFYGIETEICMYLVLGTEDATNDDNGYKAPSEPGWYQLEVRTYDRADHLETSYPYIYIEGEDLDAS